MSESLLTVFISCFLAGGGLVLAMTLMAFLIVSGLWIVTTCSEKIGKSKRILRLKKTYNLDDRELVRELMQSKIHNSIYDEDFKRLYPALSGSDLLSEEIVTVLENKHADRNSAPAATELVV